MLKLHMDAELTLEKAVNQASQSEAVKKQQSVVRTKLTMMIQSLTLSKRKILNS